MLILQATCTHCKEMSYQNRVARRDTFLDSVADFNDVVEPDEEAERQIESSLNSALGIPPSVIEKDEVTKCEEPKTAVPVLKIKVVRVFPLTTERSVDPETEVSLNKFPIPSTKSYRSALAAEPPCGCVKASTQCTDEIGNFNNVDMENIKNPTNAIESTSTARSPFNSKKPKPRNYVKRRYRVKRLGPVRFYDFLKNAKGLVNSRGGAGLWNTNKQRSPMRVRRFAVNNNKKRKRESNFLRERKLSDSILNAKLNLKRQMHRRDAFGSILSVGAMGNIFNDNLLKMQNYAQNFMPINADNIMKAEKRKLEELYLTTPEAKSTTTKSPLELLDLDLDEPRVRFSIPHETSSTMSPMDFLESLWDDTTPSERSASKTKIPDDAWKTIDLSKILELASTSFGVEKKFTKLPSFTSNDEESSNTFPALKKIFTPRLKPQQTTPIANSVTSPTEVTASSVMDAELDVSSRQASASSHHVLYLPTKSTTTRSTENPLAWEDSFLKNIAKQVAEPMQPNTQPKTRQTEDLDYGVDDYSIRDNKIHMNKKSRDATTCGTETPGVCTNNLPNMCEIHALVKTTVVNELVNSSLDSTCFDKSFSKRHVRVARNNKEENKTLESILKQLADTRNILEHILENNTQDHNTTHTKTPSTSSEFPNCGVSANDETKEVRSM